MILLYVLAFGNKQVSLATFGFLVCIGKQLKNKYEYVKYLVYINVFREITLVEDF